MEIKSSGLAVERLGRVRELSWFFLALSVPVAVFTGWASFGTAVPSSPGLVTPFWASVLAFFGGAGRLLQLRFEPSLSARASLRSPGLAHVAGGEVVLVWDGGKRSYLLAEVEEGWLEDAGHTCTAVLRMHSGDLVSIGVGAPEEGAALLRAAGVAAHQQIWTTRLASTLSVVPGVASLLIAVVVAVLTIAGLVVLGAFSEVLRGGLRWMNALGLVAGLLPASFLLAQVLAPPVLVIGGDGVSIRRFGRRRRFVSYADVDEVRRDRRSVALVLSGGEVVQLPTGEPEDPLSRAVHDRIVEAMVSRREAEAPGGAGLLDRAGRSLAAWREHLRRLGQEAEGYRAQRLAPEEMASVLEDVASPPERRVAAALALARVEDPTLRLRVHHAVASCADESLRAALEAAAADEIAEEELLAVARKRA